MILVMPVHMNSNFAVTYGYFAMLRPVCEDRQHGVFPCQESKKEPSQGHCGGPGSSVRAVRVLLNDVQLVGGGYNRITTCKFKKKSPKMLFNIFLIEPFLFHLVLYSNLCTTSLTYYNISLMRGPMYIFENGNVPSRYLYNLSVEFNI